MEKLKFVKKECCPNVLVLLMLLVVPSGFLQGMSPILKDLPRFEDLPSIEEVDLCITNAQDQQLIFFVPQLYSFKSTQQKANFYTQQDVSYFYKVPASLIIQQSYALQCCLKNGPLSSVFIYTHTREENFKYSNITVQSLLALLKQKHFDYYWRTIDRAYIQKKSQFVAAMRQAYNIESHENLPEASNSIWMPVCIKGHTRVIVLEQEIYSERHYDYLCNSKDGLSDE